MHKQENTLEDVVSNMEEQNNIRGQVKNNIKDLNTFPLTEIQQQGVNYLLANIDDLMEALGYE